MEDKKRISREDAAIIFGVSPTTLDKWRYKGTGPNYIRVGRQISYYEEDVRKYFREVCEVKASEAVCGRAPDFKKEENEGKIELTDNKVQESEDSVESFGRTAMEKLQERFQQESSKRREKDILDELLKD